MSDNVFVCPKCRGAQHAKGKCKQCGTMVMTLEQWAIKEESVADNSQGS